MSFDGTREFYELLVLLRILGPTIGPRTHGTFRTSDFDQSSYTPLRRFLDRLSWMCDYKSGGETVTSIAIQGTADGSKFWLATSYKHGEAIQIHLEGIIRLLSRAHCLYAREMDNLEKEICDKCIRFASQRVKCYSKFLLSLFKQCCQLFNDSDAQLAQDLCHLISLEKSPRELCAKADRFRDSPSLHLLSQRVASDQSPSIWSMLRHYIGRLGSWHHASHCLVSYAQMRPDIFAGFQVKLTTTPKPIHVPPADESTNLQSVLSRLFTAQEQLELKRAIEALQRLRHFDLDSIFRRDYSDKNFKPRVHAEVWLLEYFHENGMHFLDDDRRGGTMQRPSHGNVWTNWQSPLQQDRSKHCFDAQLRSAMIAKFKEDLKNQIISPSTCHGRLPDTTTGFTISDM